MGEPETEESPIARPVLSLARRCTELLLRVEQPSILDPLTPRDCLDLWSSLGYLRHGTWLQDLSPNRGEQDPRYKSLQDRLSKLLATHLSQFLRCLDKGILEALSRIDGSIKETANVLRKGRLGTWLTSYEFNGVLLDPRDQLGYAQLLMNDLGVNLSPSLVKELEAADERLREVLPAALQEFRGAGDDPPDPRSFPELFWWRHL